MWLRRKQGGSTSREEADSSLFGEADFLSLCEANVREIHTLVCDANLLNRKQCLDLSSKLSDSFWNFKRLVSHCTEPPNVLRPALENLYRYLEKAKLLVKKCGEEDWCAAAVYQLQNKNAFREILLDVALSYNVLFEQTKAREIRPVWIHHVFSSICLPACPSAVQYDLGTLQERLEALANDQNSFSPSFSPRRLRTRKLLKQYLARYLLVKLDCTSKQLERNTFDTSNVIMWKKENEPRETWGGDKFIGSGSGGGVCRTKWLGIPCAKKILCGQTPEKYFMKEAAILAHLKHPCIVNFMCCGDGEERGDHFIAMELMDMNLFNLIEDRKGSYLSLDVAIDIMVQIARGMCYLHDFGVAHRDLKPQNVVVSRLSSPHLMEYYCVKLVDFGVSKTNVEASMSNTMTAAGIGTTRYRAPEVHPKAHPDGKGRAVWFKADIYSFAMTCAHILTLQTPLENLKQSELYDELMNGQRPEFPGDCPRELVELLRNCWEINPRARPSFVQICTRLEILRHKVLRGFELSTCDRSMNEARIGLMTSEFIKIMLEEHSFAQRMGLASTEGEVEDDLGQASLDKSHDMRMKGHLSLEERVRNARRQKMKAVTQKRRAAMQAVKAQPNDDTPKRDNNKPDDVVSTLPCAFGHTLDLATVSALCYVGVCKCNLCGGRVDEEVYHCETCKFDAHRDCAEIKEKVKASLHEHPLDLVRGYPKENMESICAFCKERVQDSDWFYRCEPCTFVAHSLCISYAKTVRYYWHPHPLSLEELPFPNRGLCCHACGFEVEDYVYKCTEEECAFVVHPPSAILPEDPLCILDNTHRLRLEMRHGFMDCGVCGTDIPLQETMRYQEWITDDSIPAPNRPELSEDSPRELVDLLRDCWETNPCLRPSFLQICTRMMFWKSWLREVHKVCWDVERATRKRLQKRMAVVLKRRGAMQGEKAQLKEDVLPKSADTKRNIVLTIPCAFGHPLDLLSVSALPATSSTYMHICNLCGRRVDGKVYHCEICHFDAHRECAEIKDKAKVFFHEHPIDLVRGTHKDHLGSTCGFCFRWVQESDWSYRCKGCKFVTHLLFQDDPAFSAWTPPQHKVALSRH